MQTPPCHCCALNCGTLPLCLGILPRSKAVRPGGLLVLELPHPSDLWGGYCLEEEQFIEAWDAEVGGSATLGGALWESSRLCAVLSASIEK